MNKIYIVSGNQEQARLLARWHDMCNNEWTYVPDAHKLRGQRQQTLWLFGTWRGRSDIREIIDTAIAAEFRIFTIEDDRHARGQA